MSYFRSRRFYAGLAAGLLPLLFLALIATARPDSNTRDAERVVVRSYSSCPDSAAARRTAHLLELLPPGGVLVETFAGCCCCGHGDGQLGHAGSPRHSCVRSSEPLGRMSRAPAPGVDRPQVAPETLGALGISPHPTAEIPITTGGLSFPGLETADRGRSAGWIAVLAAPLLWFVRPPSKRPMPDGIICPDDSGLPTGPMRPTC
jgi:hypothetical protein